MNELLVFIEMKQKKIFLLQKKNSKWQTQKLCQFSIYFHENFMDWSLDQQNFLMLEALVWLNLYGHEAVRHKPKNRQKMHFLCLQAIFELILDSLTTIQVESHQSISLTKSQPMKLWSKNIENWWSWKMTFCFVFVFLFLVIGFFKKKLFCFLSMYRLKAFIRDIIHFFTMGGFSRILEKTSFQLICTRL